MRRLLEYQKYKAAGEELGARDILERTVFVAEGARRAARGAGGAGGARRRLGVQAHRGARPRARARAARSTPTRSLTDRLTISDAIARVADVLRLQRRATLRGAARRPRRARNDRADVISTFLAILEMAKLKLVRIFQAPLDDAGPGAEILVEARDTLGDDVPERTGGLPMTASSDDAAPRGGARRGGPEATAPDGAPGRDGRPAA